jgi:hypothetical protein
VLGAQAPAMLGPELLGQGIGVQRFSPFLGQRSFVPGKAKCRRLGQVDDAKRGMGMHRRFHSEFAANTVAGAFRSRIVCLNRIGLNREAKVWNRRPRPTSGAA